MIAGLITTEQIEALAQKPALGIADWIELTGVGEGIEHQYRISKDKVCFRQWSDAEIARASSPKQAAMRRDNEAKALIFPCSAHELLAFVLDENMVGGRHFDAPEAFRKAVLLNALPTEDPQQEGADDARPAPEELHQEATGADKVHLGRKQRQISEIVECAIKLGFDPLAVPRGGKKRIEERCLENSGLFTHDAFLNAWKKATQGPKPRIRMKDHEIYSSRE